MIESAEGRKEAGLTRISGFSRNWRITFRRYSYESASSAFTLGRAVVERPVLRLPAVPVVEAGGLATEVAESVGESGPPPTVLIDAIEVLEGLDLERPAVDAGDCDMAEKYPMPAGRCFSELSTPDCSFRSSSRRLCV